MRVLIMAQGQQSRLAHLDHPKHLLEVDGEPILGRTLRLLRELAPKATPTVIGWPALLCHAQSLVTLPEPGQCILDGIDATRFLWGSGRVLVLLGDVIFSRAALSNILADGRDLFFAGTPELSASDGEVFAMGFAPAARKLLDELLRYAPCRFDGERRRQFPTQQGGHLRRLVWEAQRVRMGLELGERNWHPQAAETATSSDLYLVVDDWTDDIDKPSDVARLPFLSGCARAEKEC